MPQKDYDQLMKLTDSRYKLTMVVSRRAAQLKYGVTDTLTKKPIPREKNAVSAAMEELIAGSGVRWDDSNLPTHEEVMRNVQSENQEKLDRPEGVFTVTRNEDDDLPKIPLKGAYRSRF